MKALPCPFCNELPSVDWERYGKHVACVNLRCKIRPYANEPRCEDSLEVWNTRTAHPTVKVSGDAAEMRVRLTYAEWMLLNALRHGPQEDHDSVEHRVLINRGFAERYDIGMMRITEAGRALPLTPEGR